MERADLRPSHAEVHVAIDRKKLGKLLKLGLDDQPIARRLGCSPETVARLRRDEFGIVYQKGPEPRFTKAQLQAAYAKHGTVRRTAEALRVTPGSLSRMFAARNVRLRSVREANRGEHNQKPVSARHPKLSPRWRSFPSFAAAAAVSGLSPRTIANAVRRTGGRTKSGWEFRAL